MPPPSPMTLVSVDLRLRATLTRISDLRTRSVPSNTFITTPRSRHRRIPASDVYANAGHRPPLALRADGTTDTLVTTGPALAIPSGPR